MRVPLDGRVRIQAELLVRLRALWRERPSTRRIRRVEYQQALHRVDQRQSLDVLST